MEGLGTGRWPQPAWAEMMRRELTRLPGIEPAPGPRGGEGWRVSPAVAEPIIGNREDAKAARTAKNLPQRTAAAALSSRFAIVTLDEAAQRVEARYPRVELAPRLEFYELQAVRVDTIVEHWLGTRRCAGLRVVGGAITCDWQHAGKLARVLAQLDDVVAHHIEAAAGHYEARLAALAPYRTAAVGSQPPRRRARPGAGDGTPGVEARAFLTAARDRDARPSSPDAVAAATLGRLLAIAHNNTGQSCTLANLLLAWWGEPRGSHKNAKGCGG